MVKILGIETSCDETAAAVVELNDANQGCILHSNVVFSSMDLHAAYGGVVPEIAARSHIESITPVINQALTEAIHGQGFDSDGVQGNNEQRASRTYGTESESRRQMTPQSAESNGGVAGSAGKQTVAVDDLWDQIDGIAVTYGAGLGGSLLVGVMAARTLAIAKNKPLYAINHVEGHIYANFITCTGAPLPASPPSAELRKGSLRATTLKAPLLSSSSKSTAPSVARSRLVSHQRPAQVSQWIAGNQTYSLRSAIPEFPMLGIIVSGGHSQLVLWRNHFDYTLLGQTHDDAIGEAFDKVAKILGLPYPGGPSIGKKAQEGDPFAYNFPKARLTNISPALQELRTNLPPLRSSFFGLRSTKSHSYDFSFSGLKTAVLRLAQQEIGQDHTFPSHKLSERLSEAQKANIAASFQRIAIETIVDKAIMAYEEFKPKSVVIGGGVAASSELRKQLADRLPLPIEYTDFKLMTDNGAMIAALGCYHALLNQPFADPYSLEIEPNLSM
jgi:N6-L-threonylcarbamoyladenine synthase